MVKKSTSKLKRYVDFKDLNQACPKDCFRLSRISLLVDSIARHEMLSFLNAF